MKKIRLWSVAACATVIVLIVGFALPSGANTTVSQQRLKGAAAQAEFESVDGSGCVVTDVFVQGQQVKEKNTPIPSGTLALVSVSEFDQCTFTQLVFADGSASLPASAFQIDPKLNAASLIGSVDVTDILTSNTFTVDVNVAWTGSGAIDLQKSHQQFKSGGFTVIDNFHGASRLATATGTVSQGGTTLVSGDAVFADLFNSNEGTVQIVKS